MHSTFRSIDPHTIESAHVEEIYAHDENEMLEKARDLAPTITMKDLVITGKEKRIDGSVATYYKPVSCLQIRKKVYGEMNIAVASYTLSIVVWLTAIFKSS